MTTDTEQTPAAVPTPATAQPGERYAGIAFENGQPSHHLFLLDAKPRRALNWVAAKEWAASIGASLPTRFESALLYANLRDQFDTLKWHWTATQYGGSGAFIQYFDGGTQTCNDQSDTFLVRAVRRLPL